MIACISWILYQIGSGKFLERDHFDYPITVTNQTVPGDEILRGLQNAVDHMKDMSTNEIFPSFCYFQDSQSAEMDFQLTGTMNFLMLDSKVTENSPVFKECIFCNVQYTDEGFLKYEIYKYLNKNSWEVSLNYLTNYVCKNKEKILKEGIKAGFEEILIVSKIPDPHNYSEYQAISKHNLLIPITFGLSLNDKTDYGCFFEKDKNSNQDDRFFCGIKILRKGIFRENDTLRYTFSHFKET